MAARSAAVFSVIAALFAANAAAAAECAARAVSTLLFNKAASPVPILLAELDDLTEELLEETATLDFDEATEAVDDAGAPA